MAEPVPVKRWKTGYFVLGGFGSLVVLGIALLVISALSVKEGTEFSPDDFTQRKFSYAKVEWLGWTPRGIIHISTTTDFQQKLVSSGFVKLSGRQNKVWHLVEDSVSDLDSPDFDARILINYMKSSHLQDWSFKRKNKSKSKVLWPAVATLARNNAYWGISDLIELTNQTNSFSDAEFKAIVEKRLSENLALAGSSQLENEDFEAAESSLTAAISVKPTAELLRNRAKVYDSLEKTTLAEKDRQAAKLLD